MASFNNISSTGNEDDDDYVPPSPYSGIDDEPLPLDDISEDDVLVMPGPPTAAAVVLACPDSVWLCPMITKGIKLAKVLPVSYKLPDRHKVAGAYMDLLFDERRKSNLALLQRDIEIFGCGGYCDGATVKRRPLLNYLLTAVHNPAAVMESKDCSEFIF
jgi:hypothetical protein